MFLSSVFGLVLSVVALSTLVAGETIIRISSIKVTNNPNDYFGEWSTDIHQTKKSSQLSVKMPVKMDLPDTMQMKLIFVMNGGDPIEHVTSICEGLDDETIGKSFAAAGIPKDAFPKECPFIAGDWGIAKWDPPTEKIPPGTPDGPISGSVMMMEEGKEPYVQMDFEGELENRM